MFLLVWLLDKRDRYYMDYKMTSAKVSNCQNWSELVQINVKKSPLKGDFFY
ncbi:hypothetical protein H336_20220 [Vibrio parahaemolyticus EN9701072]|nr:hypothetical protein H331_10525 [Vibrio parahaemolyticus 3644]KIT56963.1 hypothetical protein H336_20220 [Vibrio parahaemolyticus EN9701072]